jgi:uncharacterized OB-fold protein
MSAADSKGTSGIPLPRPTALSKPHWDGCREGILRVQRCADCEEYVFIPQVVCPRCLGGDLEWVASSGRGTLYSYTIVHRPQQPAFEVPYVPIIVELEEGWFMLSNLDSSGGHGVSTGSSGAPAPVSASETRAIEIGMALEVAFRKMNDEITLPYFRPALAAIGSN